MDRTHHEAVGGSTLATPSWETGQLWATGQEGSQEGEAVIGRDVRSGQEEIVKEEMNSIIF